jgi:magnesium-transporting ATPase (P-type)
MTSVIAGLSSVEASRRLAPDGPNQLPEPRRPSALRHLGKQFTHLLAILLWVASGLALLAGQPTLAVAIVVVIVLNAIFAFAQEYRADRSAERLRSLLPMSARVRRDCQLRVIDATQLVRGDLVVLRSGDRISADLTLTVSHALAVDESMVSGESVAVRHAAGELVVAGTFVVQGEGEGVVNAIGAHTTIAGIAALTRQAHRPPSPLTVQLNRVVKIIAVIAIIAGALLGMAGLGMGLAPTQAFLFAVGVAVALVPEGLLPTVTLSLARGASLMAGRNALVRHIDAVETLGATTYICTDKTGTLTQNRMAVVEVWTPAGTAFLDGLGYEPTAQIQGSSEVIDRMRRAAESAVKCVAGRLCKKVRPGSPREMRWQPRSTPGRCELAAARRRNSPFSFGSPILPIACSARWSSPNAPSSLARLRRFSAGAWARFLTMSSMILQSGVAGCWQWQKAHGTQVSLRAKPRLG